jgi:hypothetical protein
MTSFVGTLPPNETDLYKIVSVVRRLSALNSSGTWTPTFTFATPGDLSFTYGEQVGTYTKLDKFVILTFQLILTSFTFTTAAGLARIEGAPFPLPSSVIAYGNMGLWNGFVFAGGHTHLSNQIQTVAGATNIFFVANGSGVTATTGNATTMPSGTSKSLRGSVFYPTP